MHMHMFGSLLLIVIIMIIFDNVYESIMFSCWALAHGCYVVQVKEKKSSPSLEWRADVVVCTYVAA